MESNAKHCRHCGIEFVRPKSGKHYPGFCSGRCMGRFYREQRRANPPTPPESKRCHLCGEEKAADAFPRTLNSADGLHSYCRDCLRGYNRGAYPARREADLTAKRTRYATNDEYSTTAKRRARERYYDNYEDERERQTTYREAMSEEQRERRRQLAHERYLARRARVDDLKSGRSCERCGESHPATLEFHHRDPTTKLFAIVDGVVNGPWTDEEIAREVAKCALICSNCHNIIHWEEARGAELSV